MSSQLGKTIRIFRQAKSMRVGDVARQSGISMPFLSLVESGNRQPSIDVLRRIAASLDVPPEALVAMGMGNEAMTGGNKRAAKLTETVGRLIEIEERLGRLLRKESDSAAQGRNARSPRGRDGTRD